MTSLNQQMTPQFDVIVQQEEIKAEQIVDAIYYQRGGPQEELKVNQ